MNNDPRFEFNIDKDSNTVTVVREFAASLERVWKAWTTAELLDQWWAPKPWKARTRELNLEPGGRWLYAMVGPDNSEHWCRAIYETVSDRSSYTYTDAFCNAAGEVTEDFPGSHWNVRFAENGSTTIVTIKITHRSAADLERIMQMGFQGGFTMGLSNLDGLLAG